MAEKQRELERKKPVIEHPEKHGNIMKMNRPERCRLLLDHARIDRMDEVAELLVERGAEAGGSAESTR